MEALIWLGMRLVGEIIHYAVRCSAADWLGSGSLPATSRLNLASLVTARSSQLLILLPDSWKTYGQLQIIEEA